MSDPLTPRGFLREAARRLLDAAERITPQPEEFIPPRLIFPPPSSSPPTMSRARDRILLNLDEMYREAFDRAKASGDANQMTTLDFAYRREQLYFEILLDIRDAMERR
jgi:hypothetical protein